ncbi:hypothetical protein C8Q76DRAFT_1065 [Earliella scabrosa]|nr:hypothetical protein C8Q76DRAFT_1065 [Earliella scabrosa]
MSFSRTEHPISPPSHDDYLRPPPPTQSLPDSRMPDTAVFSWPYIAQAQVASYSPGPGYNAASDLRRKSSETCPTSYTLSQILSPTRSATGRIMGRGYPHGTTGGALESGSFFPPGSVSASLSARSSPGLLNLVWLREYSSADR